MSLKCIVPVTEVNRIKYYVHNGQLFNIINEVHLSVGHGGRNRMKHVINIKLNNVIR